jgi:hypothetical protein
MSEVPGSGVSKRWIEWRRTVDLVKYDQRWDAMAARGAAQTSNGVQRCAINAYVANKSQGAYGKTRPWALTSTLLLRSLPGQGRLRPRKHGRAAG